MLAREPLREFGITSLQRLYDVEVIDDGALGTIALRDCRRADGTHVNQEVLGRVLYKLRAGPL